MFVEGCFLQDLVISLNNFFVCFPRDRCGDNCPMYWLSNNFLLFTSTAHLICPGVIDLQASI